MSSQPREPAAGTMLRAAESACTDLWAKAAELERDFAGYKRRLAERRACTVAVAACRAGGAQDEEEAEERGGGDQVAGRGRRYEEYVRRRDKRLRQEWRARMERKEAEMKALWGRLDRAGSRGRRGGDGDHVSASHAREDHVNLKQKPGNLEVKVKPVTPVTPRCTSATKLARPRTSVPPSPAAASPRLSTSDVRRRSSHLHRELPQAEPPSTPRKEKRLPPPSTAAPATPRPRTTMSRSRSLLKDRGGSSVMESPRPPRFQPPRSSYDGACNLKELARPPDADAVAVMQSSPCFSEHARNLKKASAVAPEPFRFTRSGIGIKPASAPLVTPRDEPDTNNTARAGGNGETKSNNEDTDQSSDNSGSVEITGDSDTEPSYVYIKKDTDEKTVRSPQALACPATSSDAEPTSENRDSDNIEDAIESANANTTAGESPMADAEEASRRESSESLYSNVQSSFSQRSELNTSATNSPLQTPPSCTTPATVLSPESGAARPRKNPEEKDAEKRLPIPSTPRSSVTVSITVQSPMDAMTGLKRFLTFGKKNGKGGEAAAAVELAQHSVAPAPPAGDGSTSAGCPPGDSVKARLGSSDAAASDDLDNSYVISSHVRSLQSFGPSYPANPELKEAVPHAKSPRVHRSFFSFSSFRSRAN